MKARSIFTLVLVAAGAAIALGGCTVYEDDKPDTTIVKPDKPDVIITPPATDNR